MHPHTFLPKRISAESSKLVRPLVLSVMLSFPLTALTAQVELDWVQYTGGNSIAVDGADNVYTVNYVYNPGGDIILTKRDPNGNFLWEAAYDNMDNTKWENSTWVATDNAGNILVSGDVNSGYSNPVKANSILMKFSPGGALMWRVVYENVFDGSYTKRVLVDDLDNVYVLGTGYGPAGFVTKVKKFTPDGAPLWSYFDDAGIGFPVNCKFTPDGGIVIIGRSLFGSVNGYAKIDLNGIPLWSFPGVYSLTVGDAAGDQDGNTYLVHTEYITNGTTVLKKVSPSGSLLWEDTYSHSGFRVEVGSDNNPVVCGFPNQNTTGSSFLKVDSNGGLLWSNSDADGPLALLLHAMMLMDEDGGAYLAAGTLFEMAVCKVNSDGSSAWTATMSGSYAYAFALGNNMNVYVVGGTTAKLIQDGPGGVSCGDIFFFNAKCNANGAAQAMVKINGDYTGETVTFDLDGEPQIVTLQSNGTNSIGKMTVPHAGMGSHTVTLVDPASCYAPVTFNCQVDAPPDPAWDALWAENETLEQMRSDVPDEVRIIGNYPNPFNPSTSISYAINVDSFVSLKIYSSLGEEVAALVNEFQTAGYKSVTWNGRNDAGSVVASGLYFYRLSAGNEVRTEKMMFMK